MARSRQTFKIEGLKELERILKEELPKATARNVLLRVGKEQMAPVANAGEANAPKRSGELAQSYTVGTKLSRRQKKLHKRESSVEIFAGPTPHPKSVQTEFGNAHQAPEPHLRPAWDANVGRVLEGVKISLAEQIEKARARLARKAAKLIK